METTENTAVAENPIVEDSFAASNKIAKSNILREIQFSIERSKSEDPACYGKGNHYQYGKS
jgi:hypothetical protein